MKKTDIIILSLCVGFFVIAIYETIVFGITYSYWWFMVSIGLLFYYSFRRRSQQEREESSKGRKSK